MLTLRIGTSGWQYRDWRGAFYPEKLAQSRWLEHYIARFATVGLEPLSNNTPEALREQMTQDLVKYTRVVKASGITTEQ